MLQHMQSDLMSYNRTILYLPALLFSLATLNRIIQSKEKKDKDNNKNILPQGNYF
jgi:hypothetical protein